MNLHYIKPPPLLRLSPATASRKHHKLSLSQIQPSHAHQSVYAIQYKCPLTKEIAPPTDLKPAGNPAHIQHKKENKMA